MKALTNSAISSYDSNVSANLSNPKRYCMIYCLVPIDLLGVLIAYNFFGGTRKLFKKNQTHFLSLQNFFERSKQPINLSEQGSKGY